VKHDKTAHFVKVRPRTTATPGCEDVCHVCDAFSLISFKFQKSTFPDALSITNIFPSKFSSVEERSATVTPLLNKAQQTIGN
jgi:hypothetical protein